MAIGGRFGFDDGGETPNTQVAVLDYQPAPLICEVRNVRVTKEPARWARSAAGSGGVVIECEGGYYAGDATGGTLFDRARPEDQGHPGGAACPSARTSAHMANFLAAVRSRRAGDLHAEALEGHVSTACCHMANISYRLGKRSPPEASWRRSGATRSSRMPSSAAATTSEPTASTWPRPRRCSGRG